MTVTVAIPVRDGGARFHEVLEAIRAQELDRPVELLVCDSGSRDGTVAAARAAGARVIEIPPERFSHGGTRDLLMAEAAGERVAFVTADAVPASPHWLAELLAGFDLADDVALTYGPYTPIPGASQPVARELRAWFTELGTEPRVDRFDEGERASDEPWRVGPQRLFFTDANGCVDRAAWQRVRFREIGYAEDQQLALDMLRAGYAKAYMPRAAVVHSHDYPPLELFRRSFDEFRGLHEVTGLVEPLRLSTFRGNVTSRVRADALDLRATGAPLGRGILVSVRHHLLRWIGAVLGTRADSLPRPARLALSREKRA